jgi:hypothetical protein
MASAELRKKVYLDGEAARTVAGTPISLVD